MLGELKKSSVALLEREPRGQGKSEAATYGKGQVSETYEPCYRNVDCILRTRGRMKGRKKEGRKKGRKGEKGMERSKGQISILLRITGDLI